MFYAAPSRRSTQRNDDNDTHDHRAPSLHDELHLPINDGRGALFLPASDASNSLITSHLDSVTACDDGGNTTSGHNSDDSPHFVATITGDDDGGTAGVVSAGSHELTMLRRMIGDQFDVALIFNIDSNRLTTGCGAPSVIATSSSGREGIVLGGVIGGMSVLFLQSLVGVIRDRRQNSSPPERRGYVAIASSRQSPNYFNHNWATDDDDEAGNDNRPQLRTESRNEAIERSVAATE